MSRAASCGSSTGLADPVHASGRGGRNAGALGSGEEAGAGPAWLRHAYQLGMRPCSFLRMTGRLCPTCGMTTSFAWLVRGRIDRSWQANPAGCVLALLAVPLSVWLVLSAVANKPVGFQVALEAAAISVGCGRRS